MARIPRLYASRRANGAYSWHWKPDPGLRKAGWTNRHLGDSLDRHPPAAVVNAAIALNQEVAAWRLGFKVKSDAATAAVPRKWLFADLVDAYKASAAYKEELAGSTRREYDSRMRQLTYWADDGRLPILSIDAQMVRDLKTELLGRGEDGKPGSRFKCAAMLRVLRLLLRWAKNEALIPADPTAGVDIPSTPSRVAMLTWRDVQDISALPGADVLGARALRFGFWTMQRREDLCQLNRFQWRELHGADPRDLPALVNPRGEVWGFRVTPTKTKNSSGVHVDCPMPAFLHAEIEAAFAESQWLFPHSQDPAKHMSGDVMRRQVKPLLVAGGFPHMQLRDMRRSGMSWVKDMGAEKSDVFAISGHPLDGQKRTMADVYMPPNTKAACRAIAAACRTLAAIEAREKEQGR